MLRLVTLVRTVSTLIEVGAVVSTLLNQLGIRRAVVGGSLGWLSGCIVATGCQDK